MDLIFVQKQLLLSKNELALMDEIRKVISTIFALIYDDSQNAC